MNADSYARVHFVNIRNRRMLDSNDYYDVISTLLANQLLNLIRYMVSGHHLTLKYIISIMKIWFAFLLRMFQLWNICLVQRQLLSTRSGCFPDYFLRRFQILLQICDDSLLNAQKRISKLKNQF